MKRSWKKILRKLKLNDGFWSFPLAIFIVFIYGFLQERYTNDPIYSFEWLNKALMTWLIMLFLQFVLNFRELFNDKGLWDYWYKQDSQVRQDYKQMPIWLKVYTPLFVRAFYWLVAMIIFLSI